MGRIHTTLKYIPVIIRYVILPIFLTIFMDKLKPDGMNFAKYFGFLVVHLFTRNLYTEYFEENPRSNSKYKIDGWCVIDHAQMSD